MSTLTIQNGSNSALIGVGGAANGIGVLFASGVGVTIFAQDTAGTQSSLIGYVVMPNGNSAAVGESYMTNTDNDGDTTTTNNGTNNELVLYYGINGGPCDGFGGGDSPFHPCRNTKSITIGKMIAATDRRSGKCNASQKT